MPPVLPGIPITPPHFSLGNNIAELAIDPRPKLADIRGNVQHDFSGRGEVVCPNGDLLGGERVCGLFQDLDDPRKPGAPVHATGVDVSLTWFVFHGCVVVFGFVSVFKRTL